VYNLPRLATDGTTTTRFTDLLPSGGHGLLGLRERATLLGGDFHAGPTEQGGFTVLAVLPLPPD
jgi:signal transduction histidine kinase